MSPGCSHPGQCCILCSHFRVRGGHGSLLPDSSLDLIAVDAGKPERVAGAFRAHEAFGAMMRQMKMKPGLTSAAPWC